MDSLEPLNDDDPGCYDLVQPDARSVVPQAYSLEQRAEDMFSREHLQEIFDDPSLLLKFSSFLGTHRRSSVPTLIYYLDALKALRAIRYANAVADGLDPIEGQDWTKTLPSSTRNKALEEKARNAFDRMAQQDLPAYVTFTFIGVVSVSIQRRITNTMPPHLREASEGLAEVFVLSDPSRQDCPIVFASEGLFSLVISASMYTNSKQSSIAQHSMACPIRSAETADSCKGRAPIHTAYKDWRRL